MGTLENYGKTMGKLWEHYGKTMGKLWENYGVKALLLCMNICTIQYIAVVPWITEAQGLF